MGLINKIDMFGFLPVKLNMSFDGFKIEPLADYNERLKYVNKETHRDGFMYPPTTRQWKAHPETLKLIKRIPRTKRPAHLYQVIPSHQITLESECEIDELRRGSTGFLIHLLGYLYGVRLQFHDWWFDGRIPIERQHNITVTEALSHDFISRCYITWNNWNNDQQKLITNILLMHNRAISYEWDWERFIIEYMVFDGCFKLYCMTKSINDKMAHGDRINYLCNEFGIPTNSDLVKDLVQLRNQLLHETLWDNSQPGTASGKGLYEVYNLRRLNQRIIPALLNYRNDYVNSGWWFMDSFVFDKLS